METQVMALNYYKQDDHFGNEFVASHWLMALFQPVIELRWWRKAYTSCSIFGYTWIMEHGFLQYLPSGNLT